MANGNYPIQHLFVRYFNNRANAEEKKEVERWIEASEQNRKEFESYRLLWQKSRNLVVSDRLDLEAALKITKGRIHSLPGRLPVFKRIKSVAAVFILALLFSFTYHYFLSSITEPHDSGELIFREVKTAYGTQSSMTLADGTRVWLNSGSRLRFPLSFSKTPTREVELFGEAYFEVAPNPRQPFIVKTSEIGVKVLGTRFNMSAYENESAITVALLEGSVELLQPYKIQHRVLTTMVPGEVAAYNKVEKRVNIAGFESSEQFTAWMDGRIVFNNDPIQKLAFRLENWYNVDIEIKGPNLNDYRFTATFVDESLEQILALLALSSPMDYAIEPARKLPDNSYTKRKIILKENKMDEY